ncbi:uncharacterized protein LOC136042322 isoform X2 [Artemia franciscana]|uniref:uncharacterized protein LOC136042322 isoform X2 n=1 Tax=Artemia franciscana TaxID=6661 RepID=UPI0032DB2153
MFIRIPAADPLIVHPSLLTDRPIGRWTAFHCLNCRTDVYACSVLDGQKTLVTACGVIIGPSQIQLLEQSDLYSKAFKIVLDSEDFFPSKVMNNIYTEYTKIYERATLYLENEEKEMLTRIKKYRDEQQAQYLKIQSRVVQERNMLLSLLTPKREQTPSSFSSFKSSEPLDVSLKKSSKGVASFFTSIFSKNNGTRSTDEMNLRHASGQPASGKAPSKLPCTAVAIINGMKLLSTLKFPTMMKWAKIASSATSYKGIPIGVGIFGAGVSMLIYHYDSIPQLRQVVEELKRLEAVRSACPRKGVSYQKKKKNQDLCRFFFFFFFFVKMKK